MLPALEGLLGQMGLALRQLQLPPVPEVLGIPVAAFNSITANLVKTLEVQVSLWKLILVTQITMISWRMVVRHM